MDFLGWVFFPKQNPSDIDLCDLLSFPFTVYVYLTPCNLYRLSDLRLWEEVSLERYWPEKPAVEKGESEEERRGNWCGGEGTDYPE